MVKKLASAGSSIIAAGPVLVPAVAGVQDGLSTGSLKSGMNVFVYEASGYNPTSNKLDTPKLTEIVIRDLAMVGVAILLRKATKRI